MREKINCILLIDDDEATNFLSNIILEEAGVARHIKTKQTAKAALNYIEDSAHLNGTPNALPFPDLILLDVVLPRANGVEVGKKLKSNASTRDIPVILGSANPYVDELCREAGAIDYVQKPFTIKALIEKVQEKLSA